MARNTRGMMIPLSAMMGEQDDDRRARPHMEAQRLELRDRFAAYHKRSDTFEPGDLVREKRGLSILDAEVRTQIVMILWRSLDWNDELDRALIDNFISEHGPHVVHLDCIVAWVEDDGSSLFFSLHDTSRLELDPAT